MFFSFFFGAFLSLSFPSAAFLYPTLFRQSYNVFSFFRSLIFPYSYSYMVKIQTSCLLYTLCVRFCVIIIAHLPYFGSSFLYPQTSSHLHFSVLLLI